jgi:hypothetical protein
MPFVRESQDARRSGTGHDGDIRPVQLSFDSSQAGALGNLIDRALIGSVTDFFEFAFIEFPVFNVADMAIIGGVAVLALWILFPPAEEETRALADDTEPLPEPPAESGATS